MPMADDGCEDREVAGIVRDMPFPFPDGEFPEDLGAVIQRTVMEGSLPAREVLHAEDNSWAVGDGVNDPNEPDACVFGCIWHVVAQNSSVAGLASLPLGHIATRSGPGEPWEIAVHEWADSDGADPP
jgi:hypothetical protein